MPDVTPRPRWFDQWSPAQRVAYTRRFVDLAAQGHDVDGEARFVDALAPRDATILDAGCGVGRVAAALAAAGHRPAGIDCDPTLIEAGRELYPGLPLVVLDLTQVAAGSLAEEGLPTAYDVIVSAGNVLHFCAAGTEALIVERLAAVLKPGGRAIFGFHTSGDYTHDRLDEDAARVGWRRDHRFATWDLDPHHADADWSVSVYRSPLSE